MSSFVRHAVRRETHSARSGLSTVTAIAIMLLAVYGLLEMVLAAAGQAPWLLIPGATAAWIAALPGAYSPVLLIAAGVLMAVIRGGGRGTLFTTRALQLWWTMRSLLRPSPNVLAWLQG